MDRNMKLTVLHGETDKASHHAALVKRYDDAKIPEDKRPALPEKTNVVAVLEAEDGSKTEWNTTDWEEAKLLKKDTVYKVSLVEV